MVARSIVVLALAGCATRSAAPTTGARAAASGGSISGMVTADAPTVVFFLEDDVDREQIAVGGVEVLAWTAGLEQPMRAVTDERGSYTISDLPPGTYRVMFRHASGTELVRDHVEVIPDKMTPVFIKLHLPAPAPHSVCVYYGTCWT